MSLMERDRPPGRAKRRFTVLVQYGFNMVLKSPSAAGCVLYVCLMYDKRMGARVERETKTERWSLRVTPAEDTIVRRVLDNSGMSLNEYVVSRAVAAAVDDLADRRVFALSPQAWDELQEILDRPATPKPRIAALLAEPSALEAG